MSPDSIFVGCNYALEALTLKGDPLGLTLFTAGAPQLFAAALDGDPQLSMHCLLQLDIRRISCPQRLTIDIQCRLEAVAGPYLSRYPVLKDRAAGGGKVKVRPVVAADSGVTHPDQQPVDIYGLDCALLRKEVSLGRDMLTVVLPEMH